MSIIRYAVVETFSEKISCDVWAGGRGGGRLEAERGMARRVKGQVSESRSVGRMEKEENPLIFVTRLSLWPLTLHAGNVQSSVGGVRADYLQGYFRRWECRPTSIVQLMHVAYTTGSALIMQYSSVVTRRRSSTALQWCGEWSQWSQHIQSSNDADLRPYELRNDTQTASFHRV